MNVLGYVPTTEQGKHFSEWVSNNIDCGVGEQKLALEYKGIIIAGTADVMGIMKDGTLFIGDHKNTSKIYNEYVSWQVSVLDYMARMIGDEKINGRRLSFGNPYKGKNGFFIGIRRCTARNGIWHYLTFLICYLNDCAF